MLRGNWLNLKINGHAAWPIEETTISFCNCQILLMPAKKETEQSAHVNLSKTTKTNAFTAVNRFLSILSWCDGVPMEIADGFGFSGSPVPVAIPRSHARTVGSCIFSYPFHRGVEPDPKVSLALALYREARTINSVAYAFLGYYKILNIWWSDRTRGKRNELVEGIRDILPKLTDPYVLRRVNDLSQGEDDIPRYLHESCRCAVAHANVKPTMDPDSWTDIKRLAADVEIIRGVAEHLIEDKGVSRSILG